MRTVRSVRLLVVLALAVGAGAVLPGPAAADSVYQTITADLNNDGIPDHATLGQVGTGATCTVTVEHGTPTGSFGAPHVHDYTSPEAVAPFCPNIGTAVKLGSDTTFDLVTGFSFGYSDLLVLHRFEPAGVYHGVIQPDTIRAADFDGDGRQDILELSGQENEIASFRNMPDGTIAAGSIFECTTDSGGGPQYVLADFNGDHGQDILLSDICPSRPVSLRAEVLFGNGQAPVVLASTSDYNAKYVVFSIDLNYDGVPDAGVIEVAGGVTTVQYFRNDGHGAFTPFASP